MPPTTTPVPILDGQFVNIANANEALQAIAGRLGERRGFTLFTLNLDHLVKRRTDASFAAAYGRATFVTADGAPVAALARRQDGRTVRTAGADLVVPICREAAWRGAPIFLFGSEAKALTAAAARLTCACPGLRICGIEAPPQGFDPFSAEADRAGARIAASGASLCCVALGAPKQEIFCDRMAAVHPQLGFLCIGAALDFLAGTQIRAPRLVRALGCEWLWRLAGDPKRLAGRYARCFQLLTELVLRGPRRPTIGAEVLPMNRIDP